jgi:C-terminal processing protease CtpA/Prc
MWQLASAAELPCSNVGRIGPTLEPAEQAELAELEALATGGSRPVRPAAWTGELFVLTNRRTASASEDFVASLQDAGAARIVGETTMGIGCGYTNGGVTLELPATGLTVRAPDCVRYRRDGRNEAEGVLPDLPVEWSDDDSGAQRAGKIVAAITKR